MQHRYPSYIKETKILVMGMFVTTAKPSLVDTDTRVQRVTKIVHGIIEIIEENRISFPSQKINQVTFNYL